MILMYHHNLYLYHSNNLSISKSELYLGPGAGLGVVLLHYGDEVGGPVLHCTVLYCTTVYRTVLYSTAVSSVEGTNCVIK